MRHAVAALTMLLAGAGAGCYCAPDGARTAEVKPAGDGVGRHAGPAGTEMVYYDNSVPGAPVYELAPAPAGEVAPFNPQELRGTAVIRRDQQFEDIPVPLGFNLDRRKLFSFQGSAFRYGKFTYDGQWTFNRTRQFYLEQMPVHEWSLARTNEKYPANGETQRYERGNEIAEVSIRRVDTSKVQVDIVVRDSRRPDPTLLADARMNVAPVPPGSTPVVATVTPGQPYRAPLYNGESVPGAVALTTTTVESTMPYPSPMVPAYTPTGPYDARPLSTPPPPAPPAANRYAATTTTAYSSTYTSTATEPAPGTMVYRREPTVRSTNTAMPFSSLQGKQVDPRTFQLDEPAGVGIMIQ